MFQDEQERQPVPEQIANNLSISGAADGGGVSDSTNTSNTEPNLPQVDGTIDLAVGTNKHYPSQRHLSSRLLTTNYTVQTSLVTSDIQMPVHCQRQSLCQESLVDYLPQFDGTGDDDPVGEGGEGGEEGQQQGSDKGIFFYCVISFNFI